MGEYSGNVAQFERLLAGGFNYILSHQNIRKVVLSHTPTASWYNVVDVRNPDDHDFNSILHNGFSRTYEALTKAGKEIYVILDNPRFEDRDVLKCKASIVRRPVSIPFLYSKGMGYCSKELRNTIGIKARDNWNRTSRELAAGYKNIHFIDLEQIFCKDDICSMLDINGKLLYKDGGHLNTRGSIYAARFIINELRK